MRIWRVAHPEHTLDGFPSGPYVSVGLSSELIRNMRPMRDAHSWEPTHPSPAEDSELGSVEDEERCGFASLGDLLGWFEGFTDLLRKNGFIVYVYEVPEDYVRVGKFGQALFNWTAAEEIFNFELFEEEAA